MAGSRSRKAESAFSFLELMVAVAVLGVSLITVMRAFSLCLKAVRRSSSDTLAMLLADSKLQQIECLSAQGIKGDMSGTDNNLRWSCVEPAVGQDGIRRIICSINGTALAQTHLE